MPRTNEGGNGLVRVEQSETTRWVMPEVARRIQTAQAEAERYEKVRNANA